MLEPSIHGVWEGRVPLGDGLLLPSIRCVDYGACACQVQIGNIHLLDMLALAAFGIKLVQGTAVSSAVAVLPLHVLLLCLQLRNPLEDTVCPSVLWQASQCW